MIDLNYFEYLLLSYININHKFDYKAVTKIFEMPSYILNNSFLDMLEKDYIIGTFKQCELTENGSKELRQSGINIETYIDIKSKLSRGESLEEKFNWDFLYIPCSE